MLERWRDARDESLVGVGASVSAASRACGGGSEVRFAPRARGAEAAAAIADELVWRRDPGRRSLAVQTALDAIESAKDALRDARARATAGGGGGDSGEARGAGSGAKKASRRAEAADAEALSRASRLAAGLALVGPAFAESKHEHGFRVCRVALVEALAPLVALAAADVGLTDVAVAALGAAAASSLRALASSGGAAEDALGAWAAATDAARTRADAEANAAPSERRARARAGGEGAAEWDGTVPEGTLVETM